MIRAARRHEIPLLPQIENAADQRYRRAGLDLVVDMPPHSLASLEAGRRRGLLWVATSPRNWQGRGFGAALIDRSAAAARTLGHQASRGTSRSTGGAALSRCGAATSRRHYAACCSPRSAMATLPGDGRS